jgi:hypothetical protein
VKLEWKELGGIPVPFRIVGELYSVSPPATGYSNLYFDLKCTFFDIDSRECKQQYTKWDPVISAILKMKEQEKAKLSAKVEGKSTDQSSDK